MNEYRKGKSHVKSFAESQPVTIGGTGGTLFADEFDIKKKFR